MMTHLGPRCDVQRSARETLVGQGADPELLRDKAGPFQPENHWVSETPAYKIRITVERRQGNALLRVPLRRREDGKVVSVVGADQNVQKINGKWLITSSAAATPTLGPEPR